MTFRGTFEHALDAKHRLTVPSKFRAALVGECVLAASSETTPGTPRSMAIWTSDAHKAYTDASLAGIRPFSPKHRELMRFFNHLSFETQLDSAHRVMIPPSLIDYAGLSRDVTVTGSGECIEVWDRASYAVYLEDALPRISGIAASLDDTA